MWSCFGCGAAVRGDEQGADVEREEALFIMWSGKPAI